MKNYFRKLWSYIKNLDEKEDQEWEERQREETNREAIRNITIVPGNGTHNVIIGSDVVAECQTADEAVERMNFIRKNYVERRSKNARSIWY